MRLLRKRRRRRRRSGERRKTRTFEYRCYIIFFLILKNIRLSFEAHKALAYWVRIRWWLTSCLWTLLTTGSIGAPGLLLLLLPWQNQEPELCCANLFLDTPNSRGREQLSSAGAEQTGACGTARAGAAVKTRAYPGPSEVGRITLRSTLQPLARVDGV